VTRKPDELPKEELEQQDGEPLDEREVMSTISLDGSPVDLITTDPNVVDPKNDELVHIPENPEERV
jgi:hypothetical protein